jgi:NADPH-dependent ferric siderophore reductase
MDPYRVFDLTLVRRRALTPSLTRFTFSGAGAEQVRSFAPDQRVKLFFPTVDAQAPLLGERVRAAGSDWYDAYRAIPDATRPPVRTYTIRALRPEVGEVDIDFVLHGDHGPASRWAARAEAGAQLSMAAPHAQVDGPRAGFEWKPPHAVRQVLVLADETAVPAALGVLEQMSAWPQRPRVRFLAETPLAEDRMETPDWVESRWIARTSGYGDDLIAAVRDLDLNAMAAPVADDGEDAIASVDIDSEILWDTDVDQEAAVYVWVAGETRAVRDIRLHLTRERGLPKRSVACMGYWRVGREGL